MPENLTVWMSAIAPKNLLKENNDFQHVKHAEYTKTKAQCSQAISFTFLWYHSCGLRWTSSRCTKNLCPHKPTMSGVAICKAPSVKASRLAREIVQQYILYLCVLELDGIGAYDAWNMRDSGLKWSLFISIMTWWNQHWTHMGCIAIHAPWLPWFSAILLDQPKHKHMNKPSLGSCISTLSTQETQILDVHSSR